MQGSTLSKHNRYYQLVISLEYLRSRFSTLTSCYSLAVPGLAEKRPSVLIGEPLELNQSTIRSYNLQVTEYWLRDKKIFKVTGMRAMYILSVVTKLAWFSISHSEDGQRRRDTMSASSSPVSRYNANIELLIPYLPNRVSYFQNLPIFQRRQFLNCYRILLTS